MFQRPAGILPGAPPEADRRQRGARAGGPVVTMAAERMPTKAKEARSRVRRNQIHILVSWSLNDGARNYLIVLAAQGHGQTSVLLDQIGVEDYHASDCFPWCDFILRPILNHPGLDWLTILLQARLQGDCIELELFRSVVLDRVAQI